MAKNGLHKLLRATNHASAKASDFAVKQIMPSNSRSFRNKLSEIRPHVSKDDDHRRRSRGGGAVTPQLFKVGGLEYRAPPA